MEWTAKEIEILISLYPENKTDVAAKALNRKIKSVYAKANKMGIYKSEEFLKSEAIKRILKLKERGISSQFKKGLQPWNKGKKGLTSANKGSFKIGKMPHNHRPINSTRLDKDGYFMIKTSEPSTWELLHRYNWEQIHGKIPKGMNLIFKDSNKQNCSLENLQLITKKENMIRNSLQRFPEELIKTIKTLHKLKRKINGKVQHQQP